LFENCKQDLQAAEQAKEAAEKRMEAAEKEIHVAHTSAADALRQLQVTILETLSCGAVC
jgi:F0F1-type ATP synthase epsilon subunit